MTALSARQAERYRPVTGTITAEQTAAFYARKADALGEDPGGCPCEERPDLCRACQRAYDEAGSSTVATVLAVCILGPLIGLAFALGVLSLQPLVCWANGGASSGISYCQEARP